MLGEATVELAGPDARHLLTVRRAVPGDEVTLADGQGTVATARIETAGSTSLTLALTDRRSLARPRPRLEVLLALAKAPKPDDTLRQLVELGVDAVTLFPAERSVARWDAGQAAAARRRWEGIAQAAAKQSHRAWLPELAGPLPIYEGAERAARPGVGLVADPGASQSLAAVLADAPPHPEAVWVAIGPEGGLTAKELEVFERAGAVRVTLGTQILRAQTAPIVLASILLYHFARFGR